MLPRRLRIPRAAFPDGRQGNRASSSSFSLVSTPSPRGGAAAVVSKAVAKRSVDRHLLKRRILAILRPFVRGDRHVVIYAKKQALTLPFSALKDELAGLLTKALR